MSFDDESRVIGHLHVWLKLSIFEQIALGSAETYHGDAEVERRILESHPVDRTHGTRNRHTHDFAELIVLIHPGSAVSVGVVGLARNHNRGTQPAF